METTPTFVDIPREQFHWMENTIKTLQDKTKSMEKTIQDLNVAIQSRDDEIQKLKASMDDTNTRADQQQPNGCILS
jgi:prefoldin subunit 5